MQDAGANDPPLTFDYNAFLDFVQANGHNFFRTFIWESWQAEGGDFNAHVLPTIYKRTGPGNALDGHPRFDLTQFNQDYFDRIRARVIQAGQRGFYVSLMLFEGFSVQDKHGTGYSPYPGHPYNVANNINGIDGDPNDTGDGGQIQTLNIPAITALQDAYTRKLIDTVNDLDNVLFEICNESEANPDNIDWQNHFIDYVHTYEASKPKQHPVGFTVPWPGGDNADLFASNAEWVSPNDSGEDTYKIDPPAADGSKVVIADTDHLWGLGGDRIWAWKSFTRGLNPIFMDPYDDYASFMWNGLLEPDDPSVVSLRANIGYILKYADKINLAVMTPRGDLSSSGYCLANPVANRAEYLIYLPDGGNINVNLSDSPVELSVEWFNPQNGTTVNAPKVIGGNTQSFSSPFSDDAVLYIYHSAPASLTPTMTKTLVPPTSTSRPHTSTPGPSTLTQTQSSTISPVTQVSSTSTLTPTFPTLTMTNTPMRATTTKTQTSTKPPVAIQSQTSTPISLTLTPPPPSTSPLPCAQGFIALSGLFFVIVWSGSLYKKRYDDL
jgi:hypothetical protein